MGLRRGDGEPTTLVGRDEEVARLRELLGTARVLTLTGPGGVGKTRLSRRVMTEAAASYEHGAHFVPLADLRDPQLLATTVAQALGRTDAGGATTLDALVGYLAGRHLLLVLDNCEHLVDEVAALVHAVTAGTPRVHVLTTSRQSLAVAGEQLFVVPPLAVPDDDTPAGQLAACESVRLFAERARAVVPDLTLSGDQLDDVARLCRQLDGLPLAIELAAARMRVLSARQISERLDQGLALLTGGARTAPLRQQTMRAAIDGSYELCTPVEQAVWARASVFAGSFDLEAAEFVCHGGAVEPAEVVLALHGLVDKSILIRSERAAGVRFRLLEPLREYGQELLESSLDPDEARAVRRRHRDWFELLATQADDAWFGPDQALWVRWIAADHANVRAALEWSIDAERDPERSLSLAMRVVEILVTAGSPAEARQWLERALAITPPGFPGRARAMAMAAYAAIFHADLPLALQLADEAEALADPGAAPNLAHVRAFVATLLAEPASAEAQSAVDGFTAAGDVRRALHPMFLLGLLQAIEGHAEAGRETLARMAEICAPAGDTSYLAMARFGQVVLELLVFENAEAAGAAAREAVRIDHVINSRLGLAYHLDAVAWVASRQGRHRRAAIIFGAAAARWDEVGASADVSVTVLHERFAGETRKALGEAEYERLQAVGKALGGDDAVAFALGDSDTLPDEITGAGRVGPQLTRRESEIAGLVAQGMTNRAIAEQLVIALRTVDTHVQNMLTKLDLRNRTELATWVMRREQAATRQG